MPLSFRPLSYALGAEVQGADLSQPLSNSEFDQIHRALLKRGILLFRDQKITREQHIAFSRRSRLGEAGAASFRRSRVGDLDRHDNLPATAIPTIPSCCWSPTPGGGRQALGLEVHGQQWHSDVSFTLGPSLGSLLRGIVIPPVGGDTM